MPTPAEVTPRPRRKHLFPLSRRPIFGRPVHPIPAPFRKSGRSGASGSTEPAAVENANKRAQAAGLGNIAQFEIGDIYDLGLQIADAAFDCVVFNKVLHHLPDPAGALNAAAHAARTVVIVEPNGYNPVLKLLERYSPYHVAHEERSFTPRQLQIWSEAAGFRVNSLQMINLVPMFCPDWLARLARRIEPLVERVPGFRTVICGQVVLVGCR